MASRENPVEFLLGNKEILALVFVAFAWIAQKLGMTKGKAELPGGRPKQAAAADDEATRTRRVQEEIRRKISERRAGATRVFPSRSGRQPAPPIAAPRPVAPGELWGELFRGEAQEPPADITAQEPEPESVPARQSDVEIKMRRLESASSAASAEAGGISADRAAVLPLEPAAASPNAWLSSLRERQGARRAIVLREVLGPPVGLRR
jgi:hypothetical protein